jgi:hypothetical protein
VTERLKTDARGDDLLIMPSSPAVPDPATATPAEPTLQELTLEELRSYRRELLSESARALRWRRLVQARLDLAVADAAPADALHRAAPHLPDPPDTTALRGLLHAAGSDTVELLTRLDLAQRDLAGYGDAVAGAASEATRELVERYTRDPAECLSAVPAPR